MLSYNAYNSDLINPVGEKGSMAQEPSTRLPLRRAVLTSRYTEVLRYTGGNAAQALLEPAVTT